ncbi:uncharacterized protein LOC121367298 [Gigantopelta aegis]|uniref:uncharacterized protein LOC121367298 n=1 Tax=Gigantopelta aegis TaxID=1735272 RepID=UPI001B88B275|nr:uncharacterized protein LOC121367298 [Gigantopelta aegis]
MNLGLSILLVVGLCNSDVYGDLLTVDISHNCPDVLYRVDTFSEVWTVIANSKKKRGGKAWWRNYQGACRMSFMTDVEDHVLCVNVFNIEIISKDVVLKFYTSPYRPERIYTKKHYRPGSWCTDEKILTMALVTDGLPSDRDPGIDLKFKVTNKSRHDIEMTYFMDSAEQCEITHTLPKQGSLQLETHRFPEVDALPATCEVSVTADSAEEYTRVCVTFLYFNLSSECSQELTITQVDKQYYNTNSTRYDCNTDPTELTEVCSEHKTLTFILTRTRPNGGFFEIQVTSKWTPCKSGIIVHAF